MKKEWCSRLAWFAAVVLTAAAIAAHLISFQSAGSLWRDEVNLVNLSESASLKAMTQDSFPVLMPLVVRGWSEVFGGGDLQLRSLGLTIGLVLLASFWIAARLACNSLPMVSVSLFALNSVLIIYGDSLRAYGLGTVLILGVFIAMRQFLQRPSILRWLALLALSVLSVQTLFQNAVLFAALCFAAWIVCWQHRLRFPAVQILLLATAAAASLLPYVSTITSAADSAANLRIGFRPALAWRTAASVLNYPTMQFAWVWFGLVAIALVRVGVAGRKSDGREAGSPAPAAGAELPLFSAAALVLVPCAFGAFSVWARMDIQPWYLLPPLALVAVSLDSCLLQTLKARAVAAGVALLIATFSVPLTFENVRQRFTNVDLLARAIAADASAQDLVIVTPWHCGITFERYFRGAAPWLTVPLLDDHRLAHFDLVAKHLGNPEALQPVFSRIQRTLKNGARVWIVGNIAVSGRAQEIPGSLPKPPLKGTGWSELPYLANWDQQLGAFLSRHAQTAELIAVPAPFPVNSYERLQLTEVRGWKEVDPSPE